MSRRVSALLSWCGSFAVAYLLGSRTRDRRTGLLAGLGAGTLAAAVGWVAYGVAEAVERRLEVEAGVEPRAGVEHPPRDQ
ncbi:hypothetical protein M0R88_14300 [Halorussus gelatinilyticus]|uniref:Uncharacterized protein n=1 Tax=Halorussus gelatinilyticus TaxID=2937524 RepID=A0A8U0IHX1_9EURY|nr:hypothetical protein [Halorussus gelatinilyticus]UPV99678.1 hypothetical protein M0R88_14300 [Halorussus gelatinilyticus]